MSKVILALAIGCIALIAPSVSLAQYVDSENQATEESAGCPDSGAITDGAFLDDMCWDCMFPLRIAGMGGSGSKFPNDMAAPICVCPSKSLYGYPTPGFTFGMWKPTHFSETVRTPGCFAALGEKEDLGDVIGLGQGGGPKSKTTTGFHSTHLYLFPTGAVLDMITDNLCSTDDAYDLDIVMMTEIDPTYSNAELSMTVNPESYLFNNPIATAACMADAVASSTYRPIRSLFWCFGSWGQTYPLSGYSNGRSAVQDASIGSARLVAMQHKRMLMKRTYGNSAVCMPQTAFTFQKHQYRWQVLYPLPQKSSNDWTGSATMLSREWRHAPVVGEDWVQVLFSYEECCVNTP